MDTVSLEILKNYILSEGGTVSSHKIVEKFRPFLKDPINKERNKELFKSYLSTLTDYKHVEGSKLKILELKKEFRCNDYIKPVDLVQEIRSPKVAHIQQGNRLTSKSLEKFGSETTSYLSPGQHQSDENLSVNSRRHTADERSTRRRISPSRHPSVVNTKTLRQSKSEDGASGDGKRSQMNRTSSINAINMFNKTAQRPVENREAERIEDLNKGDTLDSAGADDEQESGCSNLNLEQTEKEWMIKTATGDTDSVSRMLLQDKNFVLYKDVLSGYTGLHWACKLGNIALAKILIEAGSEIDSRSFNGQTPLHMACQTANRTLIATLIAYNADKDSRDYLGRKPYHYLPQAAPEDTKSLVLSEQLMQLQKYLSSRRLSNATLTVTETDTDSTTILSDHSARKGQLTLKRFAKLSPFFGRHRNKSSSGSEGGGDGNNKRNLRTKNLKKRHLKASDINVINRFDLDGQGVTVVNSIEDVKKEHVLAEGNVPAEFRSSGMKRLASVSRHAKRRRPSILNITLDSSDGAQVTAKSLADSDKTPRAGVADKSPNGRYKSSEGSEISPKSIVSDKTPKGCDKSPKVPYLASQESGPSIISKDENDTDKRLYKSNKKPVEKKKRQKHPKKSSFEVPRR